MARKNPIEDANLLYIAFIIIAVVGFTVLIVEGTLTQGKFSNLQTEKTLSDLKIDILSSNSFEISLKITNRGFSIVEKEDISFYWNDEKIDPEISPETCLRKEELWIVKIDRGEGELKIFYKDKLIYSHYLL
ncbi:MAG: hypothetical protein J7L10_04460 [Methanomicrobia archaeon]|nr:hypothetical protein [Methanomicrobia archaeon]RLF92841.1 MAG: hypothetical protein DRN50_08240 [Thermococci archaeon]